MANRNFSNGNKIGMMVTKPVMIPIQFKVDSSNANGLGVSATKLGPLVQNVFMHTSQTPGAGNRNLATPNVPVINPNPVAGLIIVQLQDNYKQLLGLSSVIMDPASGSDVKIDNSAMTAGQVYKISILGDATLAKWRAIGVPKGITPAVGVIFIAASNGGAGNALTSRVQTMASDGAAIDAIRVAMDPSLMLSPLASASQGFGAQIVLAARKDSGSVAAPVLTMDSYTPAGVITNGTPDTFAGTPAVLTGTNSAPAYTRTSAIAAPVDGSIIQLSLLLGDSGVIVSGQ